MSDWNISTTCKAIVLSIAFGWSCSFSFAETAKQIGEQIYLKQCASCHGNNGEGVDGEYEEKLIGDWSQEKLIRYVIKNMPEDKPNLCVGDEAKSVAQYVFETFYSSEAQLRNEPPRIKLNRLTNRQYRESVTDLFREEFAVQEGAESGLTGSYFNSKGMNKKNSLKKTRVDQSIDFDFGAQPPMEGIKAEQFSIAWEGSLRSEETGFYEFRLTTPNGARLYLNINLKDGDKNYRDDASKESHHPLIDAWVSSGNKSRTETARIFLQGNRDYPIRLDFFKYKEKTGSIRFEWLPPNGIWSVPSGDHFSTRMGSRLIVSKTSFPADDRSLGYERGSDVSKEWLAATTRAALDVAEQVNSSLGHMSGVKERNDPEKLEKLKKIASEILERAYRRPLTIGERERGVDAIFMAALSPEVAVKRVVLLALKSPHFLYPDLPDGKTLPYQIASRIALGAWDSIPDEELFIAARENNLSSKSHIKVQVERMIQDPRAKSKVIDFFHHWLDLDFDRDLRKDSKTYPEFKQENVVQLRRSLKLFIENVVWSESSDYRELLLASHLYLNSDLAELYGKVIEDEEFERVDFEPEERSGLITHPYLLVHFSYRNNSSPVHRGVFLTRQILGRFLKAPPQAVSFKESELDPSLSMREKVTLVTKDSNCMGCHGMINSLGFSLENYDGIGRWRDTENKKTVNSITEYETRGGKIINLKGARSLGEFIAEDTNAQKTFVRNLFEYMIKQPAEAYGKNTIDNLHLHFRRSKFNCKKLIVEILCVASMKGIEKEKP